MKKFLVLFLFFVFQTYAADTNDRIELAVSGVQHAQMNIAIVVIDATNKQLNEIAEIIAKNLSFTEQFSTHIKKLKKKVSQKEIQYELKNLFLQGIPLALCLNFSAKKSIEWRLYDTMQLKMIEGKKYSKRGSIVRAWAHNISDTIWKTLSGNEGFFSSRIAYCKERKAQNGKLLRNIYVADFDGSYEELLVSVPTVTVAPRWNADIKNPLLFYSEYTDTNVRLMTIDLKKNRKVASNFDGINMLPTFSSDGTAVVYAASRGDGHCQLYHYKNGTLQRLTKNRGNNVSPSFVDDKHVYFCSDAQTGNPQIYRGNLQTGKIEQITCGASCYCPSYCLKNNKLAYIKMVRGTMQLFVYDCTTQKHMQLTKDAQNKYECSWSPDGTQLIFSVSCRGTSQIAMLNLLSNRVRYITSKNEHCSYPTWSPCYMHFPVVS